MKTNVITFKRQKRMRKLDVATPLKSFFPTTPTGAWWQVNQSKMIIYFNRLNLVLLFCSLSLNLEKEIIIISLRRLLSKKALSVTAHHCFMDFLPEEKRGVGARGGKLKWLPLRRVNGVNAIVEERLHLKLFFYYQIK